MDEDVSKPARLRDLNDEMLQLSKAERRLRSKHYLAKVTTWAKKAPSATARRNVAFLPKERCMRLRLLPWRLVTITY